MSKRSVSSPAERRSILFLSVVLVFGLSVLGYSLWMIVRDRSSVTDDQHDVSSLRMTSFDRALARQLMDKDHDEKCDACGMPVDICIDGGQMECTMVKKDGIGILNSDHLHADWKIYVNNQLLDLSGMAHMDRMAQGKQVSSFMHVDSGAPGEKTGDVLHMHAKNVPLWLFFESVGMKLTNECITLENDEHYCDDGKHRLRMYANGVEQSSLRDYVFHDLDKILITYGDDENMIPSQLASITNFAKDH